MAADRAEECTCSENRENRTLSPLLPMVMAKSYGKGNAQHFILGFAKKSALERK
jgi:hypothetical protein